MAREMVLYRDEDVLVVNKPAGLNVMPGPGRYGDRSLDSLRPALRFDASENPRFVHRLDRDTSGCVILARNRRAAYELSAVFRKKADESDAAAADEAEMMSDPERAAARSLEEWAMPSRQRRGGRRRPHQGGGGKSVFPFSSSCDDDEAMEGTGGEADEETSTSSSTSELERVYWALVSAKPAHGRIKEGYVHAPVAQLKHKEDGTEVMAALGLYKVTDAMGRTVFAGDMLPRRGRGWEVDESARGGVKGRASATGFRVIGMRSTDEEKEKDHHRSQTTTDGAAVNFEQDEQQPGGGGGARSDVVHHNTNPNIPVLLELTPRTGRKHQLRVHCAAILRCPVVGDYKHGYRDLKRRRFRNKLAQEWKLVVKDIENEESRLARKRAKAAAKAARTGGGRLMSDVEYEYDEEDDEDKFNDWLSDRERSERRAELDEWAEGDGVIGGVRPPGARRGRGSKPPAKLFGVPLHLHSREIRFKHPRTGRRMKVTAPPPKHLRAACEALGIPMPVTADEDPRVFFEGSMRSEERDEEDGRRREGQGWRSRPSPRMMPPRGRARR